MAASVGSSASKSTKRVVTTTSRSFTTSSPSAEAHIASRMRSPSPARISRLQEKEELTQLNDRLAAYIDKVRALETENSRLSVQISNFEVITQREVDGVKGLYETELADARRLLDDLAKEKAKLQIDVGRYKSESEDWMLKYNRKDHDLSAALKKVADAEVRLAKLDAKAAEASLDAERWQGEYAKAKGDVADVERQLANARKQLEEETLLRVDLENRMQSLKEELAFKSQLHQTELNETRSRLEMTVDEVDQRVSGEYESRLQEALQEFRRHHELQAAAHREEMESMYESKIASLRRELERRSAMPDQNTLLEISAYKSKVAELQNNLARLITLNDSLEQRVKQLEADLASEREASASSLAAKETQLRQLRDEMEQQAHEYQDLLDLKFSLDLELAAYRKLLEGEEERLRLSPGGDKASSSRKRRRMDDGDGSFVAAGSEASQGLQMTEYSSSSQTTGPIEIAEVSADGKFVKLVNKTDSEVALGGFHLNHVADDKQTTYKFHRTVKVEPNGTVTVWSSDSGVDHDPQSHNYVMKEQCWLHGNHTRTSLVDKDGSELASMDRSRQVVVSESVIQRTSVATYGRTETVAEQQKSERCVVM